VSRPHPFDMVFGGFAETAFPRIRADASDAAVDLSTMTRLHSTQAVLQELGSPKLAEGDPRAVAEYLSLLFVAYRYWAAGAHTLVVDRERITQVMESGPSVAPHVPHGACYLQFPRHWFWATIGEGAPHEPLDGLFVVRTPPVQLTVAAILGVRADREGFSQIVVSAAQDDVAAARGQTRDPPFAPVMDGGSAAGFSSITSEGELLYLAHLALESAAE
jgi:hypothetical protein